MQEYQIGSVVMTQQAFIILIVGFIVSMILFVGSFFLNGFTLKVNGMFMSMVVCGIACYQAYVANCAIVGKCNALAWVLVGITFLVFLINLSIFYDVVQISWILQKYKNAQNEKTKK